MVDKPARNVLPLDHSRRAMILSHPNGQEVVFGMDWSALVGADPERLGLQRARILRATHYVLAGSHATVIGTTRLEGSLPGVKRNRLRSLQSAAAHFAAKFSSGAFACLIPFEGQGCWMVASHAGSVLSQTDRLFPDIASAHAALDQIRLRFPALQIEIEPELTATCLPEWFKEKFSDSTRLREVRPLLGRVCRLLISLVFLLACSVVLQRYYFSAQEVPAFEYVDATRLWQEAFQKLSGQIPLHSYQNLQSLTRHWQKIPVQPVGWNLRKIQCESLGALWQCSAHFDRQHRLALNRDLEQLKPPDWTQHFSPLEGASWLWTVQQASTFFDWRAAASDFDWMSYLQRIGLAFEHIQIGTGSKLQFRPPLGSKGEPLPVPANFPVWQKRTLALKGPLRSLVTLDSFTMPVRWHRANLEVSTQLGRSAGTSSLILELTGELFETGVNYQKK